MDDRTEFRALLLRPAEGVAVVEVGGEVDLYTSSQLRDLLFDAIQEGADHVIVDLCEVSFIDSSGLGVLVSSARTLGTRGEIITILCGPGVVARALEITGLGGVFAIYAPRAEPGPSS